METVAGAVCTLLGVAVGALGTPAAARIQLRGAIAQADAVLAQADTTYRAALDQAYAAQRAAHEQWRREIRRDAYAAFVTALDEVREPAARPELLDAHEEASGALPAASRAVTAAFAVVELEGPTSLTLRALTVRQRGLTAAEHALRLAPRATAMRLLNSATGAATADTSDGGSSSAPARAAHQALTQLREAVYRMERGGDRQGRLRRRAAARDGGRGRVRPVHARPDPRPAQRPVLGGGPANGQRTRRRPGAMRGGARRLRDGGPCAARPPTATTTPIPATTPTRNSAKCAAGGPSGG
ncbi:hypothetical protein K6168_01625 [Streptomyces sp. FB2]|uniref:hypothetical protein n=1 Tax=Streptomyces sp. FB2 TaxID=2902454 RepID=UPI001F1979A0|nr:hypothetical protein [Streptomyces sp. FB2]MCF2534377.1 hypothetical protein [Streptomyces sp. FB2]